MKVTATSGKTAEAVPLLRAQLLQLLVCSSSENPDLLSGEPGATLEAYEGSAVVAVKFLATGAAGENKGSFRIRRYEPQFQGWVYTKDLTFKLEFAFQDFQNGSVAPGGGINDAYFNYDFTYRDFNSTPWTKSGAPGTSYNGSGGIHGFGTRLAFDF